MSDSSNGNASGNISMRTAVTVCLGIIQILLMGGGAMLINSINKTNDGLDRIEHNVNAIQLDITKELSDVRANVRILENKIGKP